MNNKTLLLAAHGSSRYEGNNPILRLTKTLREKKIYDEVLCGFLRQQPFLRNVLSQIQTRDLGVIPMFSGFGYITDTLIPKALDQISNKVNVQIYDPIGVHGEIPKLMARRATSVMEQHSLNPDIVTVLIVAHGHTKNSQNADQTRVLAVDLKKIMNGIETSFAFIEEKPLISDWPQTITTEHLIVIPYLIGGGIHTVNDIPIMLGLKPRDYDNTQVTGPLSAYGKTIWYCRAFGFEESLSDIIINITSK